MEHAHDLMVITDDQTLIDALAALRDDDAATLAICRDPRLVYDQLIGVCPRRVLVDLDIAAADNDHILFQQLSMHADSAPVPILLVAGDDTCSALARARSVYAGAQLLRKPVPPEELRSRLLNLGCREREVGA